MITEIGIIAGEIWQILDKVESVSLDEIVQKLGKERDYVLMSAGWLAREGHVTLECKVGEGCTLALRKK